MNAPATGPGRDGATTTHDAIVLAGGRASRLGGDKPNVHVAGRRLLDHVLEATRSARRVVVVGPDDLVPGAGPGTRVTLAREDPPFGGPVAGLAAGLAGLADLRDARSPGENSTSPAAPVLLLACDVPLAPGLVPGLLAAWDTARGRGVDDGEPATAPVDGVCVESGGRAQWLVGVYDARALRRALDAVAADRPLDGASMRALVGHLQLVVVPDPHDLSADVDTWHDVERIDHRLAEEDRDDRTPG